MIKLKKHQAGVGIVAKYLLFLRLYVPYADEANNVRRLLLHHHYTQKILDKKISPFYNDEEIKERGVEIILGVLL